MTAKKFNLSLCCVVLFGLSVSSTLVNAEILAYTSPKGVRLYTDTPIFEKGYKPENKAARNAKRYRSRSSGANVAAIEKLVVRLAPGYGLDPKLVNAVIRAESNFNTAAVSSKNAVGLMQLIPATAERFGVKDRLNPTENIKGGMAYLQWLLSRFEGQIPLALAGYNAGENAVTKYGGVPPFKETQRYVKKIQTQYAKLWHPYERDLAKPWTGGNLKNPRQLVQYSGRS